MNDPEQQDIKAIRNTLGQVASADIFQTSKAIYDIGRGYYQNGNFALSIALFERTAELDDPLWATQALFFIAELWRRLGNKDREIETYKKIARLPEGHKKFADGAGMGVAFSRSGEPEVAKRHYLTYLKHYGDNVGVEANLAELCLTEAEFKDCLQWSSRVASRPTPSHQIIGRLLKGSALYFMGERGKAVEEFQWIGQYLLSMGAVPADFTWDFGDSRAVLDKVDLPEGSLLIQLLDKRTTFQEFASKWAALNPVPRQA